MEVKEQLYKWIEKVFWIARTIIFYWTILKEAAFQDGYSISR